MSPANPLFSIDHECFLEGHIFGWEAKCIIEAQIIRGRQAEILWVIHFHAFLGGSDAITNFDNCQG